MQEMLVSASPRTPGVGVSTSGYGGAGVWRGSSAGGQDGAVGWPHPSASQR